MKIVMVGAAVMSDVRQIMSRIIRKKRFDPESYLARYRGEGVSESSVDVAAKIRGQKNGPAIFVHGVMPRSGTVYTGEILRLHPELHAYPNEIWEIPFLELTGDILNAQKHFFKAYPQNKGKVGDLDFLALFGASIMAYLHNFTPEGKRALLKIPDAQYISYFDAVFPHENILLLLRDGRDVVNSTIRTWPTMDFSDICKRWALSAKAMLDFWKKKSGSTGVMLVKYEEVIRAPDAFVRKFCKHFGLDEGIFPFEKIKAISVRGSSEIKDSGKVTWEASKKPAGFNPIGRWHSWPARHKKSFKMIAGEALIETGYCNDLNW